MKSHCKKEISSDGDYVHALFGLLLVWVITIRCARSYFYHFLILRIMQRHGEKEISSNDAYFHALFGLFIA